MAFDGITVAAVVEELNRNVLGGRISKIAQPENDELILTVKNNSKQYRIFISADASLPLIYLTETNKPSPLTAPGFCMLLRKYLSNAKITKIEQPGFERIIRFDLEHLNELGDQCKKVLVVEIMGKHSNIILLDENEKIIDSIKHISHMVSSVREVLPGKEYFVPKGENKSNPLLADQDDFLSKEKSGSNPVFKAIYQEYTGLSPLIANAICYSADIDGNKPVQTLSANEMESLWDSFAKLMLLVKRDSYEPSIFYENGIPKEFAALSLNGYTNIKSYDSISKLLQNYYEEKNIIVRIRQRSGDLRRILQTAIERDSKKYDLQIKQLKDTEKKDKYKLYGELLSAFGYGIEKGAKEAVVQNYYDDNKEIAIPLDDTMTPIENAKKYYDKYNKLKRTGEALSKFVVETKNELDHLESILTSLDIARKEEDLVQIKEEMIESGFVRRKGNVKKQKITSKPFHYISSDGFHMYVGKNNYQNEELTFKFANGNDMWFHAKKAPGSHVIVKTEGKELPDRAYEEAAALAAYYSKIKDQSKPEIDYTEKKNVKKPNGSAPGFVVYYTNYSMIANADISMLELVES